MIVQFKCNKTYARYIVKVDGKDTPIEFKKGTIGGGQISYAKFRTNDPKVVEAVKNHGEFTAKRMWVDVVIAEPGDDVSSDAVAQQEAPVVNKQPEAPAADLDEKKNVEGEQEGAPDATVNDVQKVEEPPVVTKTPEELQAEADASKALTFEDVTNTQQARAALKTLGITMPASTNKEGMIETGKKAGAIFPNWDGYNA